MLGRDDFLYEFGSIRIDPCKRTIQNNGENAPCSSRAFDVLLLLVQRRGELVPKAAIIVAEQDGIAVGFVTIDASGYLDQLVVAPDRWGSELATMLVDEAKRRSPDCIRLLVNKDNARAIRFYRRNGFVDAGEDANPTSGRPVLKMEWKG